MDTVSQLDREWSSLASGSLAEAFARWQRREPLLRRFESPTALLRFLQSSPSRESDAPLLALLGLAAEDRLAGRLVLQALLPVLETGSRQRFDPRSSQRELWELLLFFAWEAICNPPAPAPRRRVAASLAERVVDDTSCELRRAEPPPDPAGLRSGDSRWADAA